MKKANLILVNLLFISFFCFSQVTDNDIKERDINRIDRLNLKLSQFDLDNPLELADLNLIFEKDKKKRTKALFAGILSTIGTASIVYGVVALSRPSSGSDWGSLDDTISGIAVGAGAVLVGASVPLWISSKKRTKERDKLIKLYQEK